MMIRRTLLLAVAGLAAMPRSLLAQAPAAQTPVSHPPMSQLSAYAFRFEALSGGDIALADFAGKPILVVNTASQCGYTPQYAGLQKLWARYRDRGLVILGVPSNDFGGQEPGGAPEIAKTAQDEYHVTFPLTAKAGVKGAAAHPFYRWAATERPRDTPRWNFHKYLIGRDGRLKAAFTSAVDPSDPGLIVAIETELGA
jgi:glutathione peroxidase